MNMLFFRPYLEWNFKMQANRFDIIFRYMHYFVLVCGGGPNFSGNSIQSYTCLIIYTLFMCLTLYDCMTVPTKIGAPPKEVKNGNMIHVQYLFIVGICHIGWTKLNIYNFLSWCRGPYFGGNFIQSYTFKIYSHTLLTAKRLTYFYQRNLNISLFSQRFIQTA